MRRRTLLVAAAAAVGAGAAGLGWRAYRNGVFSAGRGPAYEAWRTWRPDGSGPMHAVHAAILAASPHNTQPWLFRVTDTSIDLLADRERNIGSIDPFRREMHIGLGCALENLVIAARAAGHEPGITLLPDGADAPRVAAVQLAPAGKQASPLSDAIAHRHTNRGPYDVARPLSDAAFEAMQGLGSDLPDVGMRWFTSDRDRSELSSLIVAATEAIIADRQQSADSTRWFRMSWEQLQRHRDGVTLDAAGLAPVVLAVAKLLPPMSAEDSDAAWLKATREVHVATAPAFGLIVVRDARDDRQRLQGGRLWQRVHLWAAGQGIAMQPLNQVLERADREASQGLEAKFGAAMKHLVGETGWQALMPFRLGYPQRAAQPSPRRLPEEVVVRM